ncbi:deoxynucleoside kinase [Lewinellaceae bacterium SD302]|nr:deoxynucleoside kinase [Lewinellaceae bacterium SD302]
MKTKLPYSFIAIEGNIGAGKTTLSEMLAERQDRRLILEQFSDNPFLPYFYENPERYAFPVELFFMTERHKQLQTDLAQTQLFEQDVVADYFFVKTLLFARNNLQDEEYRLFTRLYNVLTSSFPQPDLLVYLYRPVEALQANIAKRNRSYEQSISDEYLTNIQTAYLDYFKTYNEAPVLILDLQEKDFISEPAIYERMLTAMQKSYAPGLHRVKI